MSNFTAGEWKAEGFSYDHPYIAVKAGEQTICMIGCVGNLEEKEANARLIVSAPKLYELLKEYHAEALASGKSNPERENRVRKLFRGIEVPWYKLTKADLEEICNEQVHQREMACDAKR